MPWEAMPFKILLIDDDETIRDVLVEQFKARFKDVEISQACTTKDAMAVIQSSRSLSCIITDLQLPDGLSLDIIDFLERADMLIPTIIFSGADLKPFRSYLRPPVVLFCAKPDFRLLGSVVELIFNSRDQR